MVTLTKAGRYEIVGELGRGAMGVVYRAMDPVIGRPVAVKTIRLTEQGTGLTRPELLERFQTEARAAGLLTHPNIVVVYDAGEEDGLYYITMELVEGRSLQALLDERQMFPLTRVLRIMEQACAALQFAHERNVVHRDVKPANLMLTADDTVKVTDFGTAKILQFGSAQQTAHVMGTPSYMSPEQVKGKAVDGRSDIFSLGVVLYEMVTGEKPFPGQNITTVIYKIVNEQPVPPGQIDPSIHPGMSAVILKALEKNPAVRYQSCREMLEELRNYRALGGNAEATVVLSASQAAAKSRAPRGKEAQDAAQELRTRASLGSGNPALTPPLRRTGTVEPYREPAKKSVVGTVFAALFLLGVIGFGGYRLRPFMQDLLQRRQAQLGGGQVRPAAATPAPVESPSTGLAANSALSGLDAPENPDAEPADGTPARKAAAGAPPHEVVKKTAATVTTAAEEFKDRIQEVLEEKGFASRVQVEGTGSTLILAGRLRPREHRELLSVLRSAPESVRVVDHIEYDDAPEDAPGNIAGGDHPVPVVGRGAVHVVTDVIGATAILRGPAGREVNTCSTPCSFSNLVPQRYALEIRKEGYRPVQMPLQLPPGSVIDQKIALESLARGLYVNSRPSGADVFIDGAKQSAQTPLTLPLGAGQYNVVVKLDGYETYAGQVQIKNSVLTQLNVELTPRPVRVAWADISSEPSGAEIIIDGTPTGRTTPARVKTTAGTHRVALVLKGFRPVLRIVAVDEGQSVQISETLRNR